MQTSVPNSVRVLSATLLLWFAACSAPAAGGDASTPHTPTTKELGRVHLKVSTDVPAAQELFDQGLAWCYGFHHEEAMRCFRAAAAADPGLAMAHWGLCYAVGPHINNMAMTAEANVAAVAEAKLAADLATHATPLEQALITAVGERYATPAPDDRAELDRAY